MTCRLRRPVLVYVRHVPETEYRIGTRPAHWRASLGDGVPKRLIYAGHESATRDGAVRGIIRLMRDAGYSGVARVLPAAVLLLVLLPDPALAGCRWLLDRTELDSRYVVVCDSPLDVVPLGPAGSTAPDRPFVEPSRPGSALPPPGAAACQRRYVCDDKRRCGWRDICK